MEGGEVSPRRPRIPGSYSPAPLASGNDAPRWGDADNYQIPVVIPALALAIVAARNELLFMVRHLDLSFRESQFQVAASARRVPALTGIAIAPTHALSDIRA